MDNFIIEGGHELFGEVNISGAKNAAVAIIPAAILADDVVRIENIPAISDVSLIIKILDSMGAGIKMINKNTIEVDSRSLKCQSVPYELTSCFRASYYLIGAMLGRFKQAQVAMPGGCNFGVRPIDLHIKGFELLGAQVNTVEGIPDQIEAGTYMVAAAACGGDVLVKNVIPKHLESISAKLEEAGAEIIEYDDAVRITRFKPLTRCNVKTMPHPGFPTDMQPQMAVLLSVAEGTSILTEGVWDNRFQYVGELSRMGANIQVDGKVAVIEGVPALTGVTVKATDLRAGAAMIIAGMVARGETRVTNIQYVDRGYEDVVEKFSALGADIRRVPCDDGDDGAATANAG